MPKLTIVTEIFPTTFVKYFLTLRITMLDSKKLGLTGGIFWGAFMFILTILALTTGYAKIFLKVLKCMYPGYSISWLGSIVGLVYGFAVGFAIFYLFSWIYNKLKI